MKGAASPIRIPRRRRLLQLPRHRRCRRRRRRKPAAAAPPPTHPEQVPVPLFPAVLHPTPDLFQKPTYDPCKVPFTLHTVVDTYLGVLRPLHARMQGLGYAAEFDYLGHGSFALVLGLSQGGRLHTALKIAKFSVPQSKLPQCDLAQEAAVLHFQVANLAQQSQGVHAFAVQQRPDIS